MKKERDCGPGGRICWRKILLAMNLKLLLLLVSCFHVQASAWSQERLVDVEMRDATLEEVIWELERQSGFTFLYWTEDVRDVAGLTVEMRGRTVREVLDYCLKGTGLGYEVNADAVVIRRLAKEEPVGRKVEGVVKDASGMVLPGVSVLIKGTVIGVATDVDGRFELEVTTDTVTLVFSFVGMRTREVTWRGEPLLTVTLEEESAEMDEVVVTGYQTVSRRESASSISTVRAEEVMMDGVASIDQMLQGRIPGVAVMMTSGEPSATPKIRIRGNATINGDKAPVWVVDGVILEDNVPFSSADINSEDAEYLIGNAISGLNPRDIETITVLKDASATAIYGVRAANGVIVITTKKGKVGKPMISYSGDVTINMQPSYRRYDLMDSRERVQFSRYLIGMNVNYSKVPSGDSYEAAYEQWLAKDLSDAEFQARVDELQERNTDWFDLLFDTQVTHTHTLTLSGGSENARYYVSAGYSDVKGGAIGSETERYNLLAKVDVDYNKWLSFTTKVDFSSTKNTGFSGNVNPMDYATTTSRTVPAYEKDGSLHWIYQKNGQNVEEYIGYNILNELATTGQSGQMDNLSALLALNVRLWKGLKYEGTFSATVGNTMKRDWAEAESYYVSSGFRGYEYGMYTEYDDAYWSSELPYGGVLTQENTRNTKFVVRNMLTFAQTFGLHDVSVAVGTETTRNKYMGHSVTGYGWDPDFGELFNLMETNAYKEQHWDNKPTNTNSLTQVASFFGVASYCFNNRYVLNFNIRSDGSNKFGMDPKYRWLPAWSGAVKWIASSENFLRNAGWLDHLSFRASYGP